MATVNWTYKAYEPSELEDLVNAAIRQGHQYRNKLVELELVKRERHEMLLRSLATDYLEKCDAVEATEASLGEVREAIQQCKVKEQTKNPKSAKPLKEKAAEIKKVLKDQRAERKAAKKAAYEDKAVKAAMETNNQLHKEARKKLRADSPLYWGSRGIIDRAAMSMSTGAPPKFMRFEGKGKVAVQLQGGLDCNNAATSNSLFRIGESGKRLTEVMIRIGSEGRQPIFAKVPIRMHRSLPEGKIKWAALEKTRCGTHDQWQLRLEIDVPDPPARDSSTWVAVHLGWRKDGDGLIRVATWKGSDGRSGVLYTPSRNIRQSRRVDELRKIRDNDFNEVKVKCADWLADQEKPEWAADFQIKKWKSPLRLSSFVNRWREEGQEVPDWLEAWRKREKRNYNEQSFTSRKISRRRKDHYRKFAHKLSQDYGLLFEAKGSIAVLTKLAYPEDDPKATANYQLRLASPGQLGELTREKFGCLATVVVSSTNLSNECAECGEVRKTKRTGHKIQCVSCGNTYDDDDNAVSLMLRRGEDRLTGGVLLELREAEEERKRKAAERLRRMQDGRRDNDDEREAG